ncbi:cobaltochelatase subunit CobN [Oscillatoria salina]|uniref:cobaltochelatase subunit CobN n=1 Tax=Oscillatoria salina TaxID=331517 RepID=UPI001CCB5B0A|nr:cobaltochelatase subunit CobN [Oscillatoria salina]MBZ8182895.1 cobaltochelatase subunit CobN [Oscillatoria salina IIICB1]
MHRIAATPGGWNPNSEGVIFIEQTPAPIIFLTAADTDIQTLAVSLAFLPVDFPEIRAVNLLQLQQELTIDTYSETVLSKAKVIILRLLGGRAYWAYGLEVVKEIVAETKASLFVLPGEEIPDPNLMSHSTVSLAAVNKLWRYFTEAGVENFVNALQFVSDLCLGSNYQPSSPQVVPRVGLYSFQVRSQQISAEDIRTKVLTTNSEDNSSKSSTNQVRSQRFSAEDNRTKVLTTNSEDNSSKSSTNQVRSQRFSAEDNRTKVLTTNSEDNSSKSSTNQVRSQRFSAEDNRTKVLTTNSEDNRTKVLTTNSGKKVGLLFYRAHYLAGNLAAIEAICQALVERNLQPVPVFISSLREPDVQTELLTYFQPEDTEAISLLLNTTSFSLGKIGNEEQPKLWQKLDVPVLQVILSSSTKEQWEASFQGLTARDVAMNVALPEVDGRIITRAVSFKSVKSWNEALETDVVVYQEMRDRVNFIADLAANWLKLKQTPVTERKIALILANYPNKDGRIANGVGLDTPASCIKILKAMQQTGYKIANIPETGDELISLLTASVTNDPEGKELRPVRQSLSITEYQKDFNTLPEKNQREISDRWNKLEKKDTLTQSSLTNFPIPGIQLGNIFIGIQPSRGYDIDPSLNYHAPDLEPTPEYLAYYYWLKHHFQALAIIHLGKHGNLEWLPGKSIALSAECYPEIALGAIPNFYPFIVNDPGEGSQAKRRSHSVIIDHLTPPLTRAELYGNLQKLEALIDEYYEAQTLDPSRLKLIGTKITQLIQQENLDQELGINNLEIDSLAQFLTLADGYLCELKEAQIRDGLHIFGQLPQPKQLRDLIIAIARSPNQDRQGITRAIAKDLNLDFDPLTTNLSTKLNNFFPFSRQDAKNIGDAVEIIEEIATQLIENLLQNQPKPTQTNHPRLSAFIRGSQIYLNENTQKELTWITNYLLPKLQQTHQEITNLLRGLDAKYIPSGAAGAPTRGRPEVLPTGRNFYSVDIRAIPTETAWDVGRKAAEAVVERYTQENGEYPKSLAISVWGTSTMRTGGDDIAEALALLGVRPVWDGLSRRVVDFEILSLSALGRPRVDVTLRISGFFRDGFPNLIDLMYQAIAAVASLDEPPEQNPLAAQTKQEQAFWESQGLEKEPAKEISLYRIFGSKPGAYGAGLQGLIEAQNWTDDADLARAYINWSSYAYTGSNAKAVSAPEAFQQRLQQLQIVLHNQDNREHDLLDSDDYYQFQGGLTAAVRAVSGKNPQTYFGDNSLPSNPKVRQLKEEIARVYRSRVINPKWIAGVMRHGYKGAFEMAATVDYLFAYDATARCVEDYMYQGVAEAYLFDSEVQDFIQQKNPWALRDMAERLLEANQRNLWQSASPEVLSQLRQIVLESEAKIESII